MSLQRTTRCVGAWMTLALCALVAGGCAGLPRIDPTGERVFVWPGEQAPVVAPTVGNLQAPPVYTDPVFPQPSLVPTPGNPSFTTPQGPQDTLSITPGRMLAPVGTEVLLKTGLCTRDNYLLTSARIDWMIARESAGEFISIGGRGLFANPILPWNQAQKVDNQFATGYTAKVPLTITRGTVQTTDDVQVEPGEAWATITSPVEGTSHITAIAPEIASWTHRRATATIHWVDVQWTFPAAAVTAANGGQVLTTTVRKQTDGTPIEGWIVRYEVADGGGALRGSESGQVVEVPTDANGQASIDVTPTGAAGNTTRINTQLVRPQGFKNSDDPQLVVANGTTIVSWAGSGTPYLPPADDLGSPVIPAQPLPGQPVVPQVTRRPQLELEIFGEDNATAGGQTRFEVVIRNTGDAEATGIVLNDQFDEGLSHLKAAQGTREVVNPGIGSLAAGDQKSVFLTFDVMRPGRLCHVVTVRCNENADAQKQACVNAVQPPPQQQASMRVEKTGPQQRTVGEVADFSLVITNTGEVPLTNLEIVDEYPPSLRASPMQQGYEKVARGDNSDQFLWRIPRLEVGANIRLDTQCQCMSPTQQACSAVQVSADTGTAAGVISGADRDCLSILPTQDVVPGNSGGQDVVPSVVPGATSNLGLDIVPQFVDNTARAGTPGRFQVIIQNGPAPDQQVQLRLIFPAEMTPNVQAIQNSAQVRANLVGNELRFEPIAQLRPGERIDFMIPVNMLQSGVRNVTAEVISRNNPNPIQKVQSVTIIGS